MSDIKLNTEVKTSKEKDTIKKSSRIPFGSPQQGLSVNPVPGYFLRWVNDEDNGIQAAQQSGYEFHEDPAILIGDAQKPSTDLGTRISRVVGKDDSGHPMRAYLMKIRNEFREEDIRLADIPLQKTDYAIKHGKLHPGAEPESMYVPKDGIKINQS